MKCTLITKANLPGALRIEAETKEECLILRMFAADTRNLHIASYGGSILDHVQSILIAHKEKPSES